MFSITIIKASLHTRMVRNVYSRNVTFILHRGIDPERVHCLDTGFHSNRRIAPQRVFGAEGGQIWVMSACQALPALVTERWCVWLHLTGEKLEKSAQPVSALELAAADELQPVSADAVDGGAGTAALEAVDVPVSIGMSSKLAVHTGP